MVAVAVETSSERDRISRMALRNRVTSVAWGWVVDG